MHKHELFKAVLKTDTFKKVPWVISAFSIIQEDPNAWIKDPYPYRIVQSPIGHYYVDPIDLQLKPIEGCQPGQPVLRFLERIVLNPGDIENVTEETVTSVGTAYFNKACLGDIFGSKISYVNGKINPSKIEEKIIEVLTDTPEDSSTERDPKLIYVDEYIRFADSVFDLTNFSQLCTWGLTEKALLPPPGIKELKKKLVAENKDRLHDPAVIAKIEKELIEFDAEYLKGDPSLNFLLSAKSKNIVRKKLFLDYGAERGLGDGVTVDFINNSLIEGWELDKFAVMNNTLRAGSFDRGSETQLGGVTFKEIIRATSNISIDVEDCGSMVGRPIKVTQDSLKHIKNFSIVTDTGSEFIADEEQASKYLGTVVRKRSMMYCTLDGNAFCKTCAGKNLSNNSDSASMAAAQYGSVFLALFMSSMHGKTLTTATFDWKNLIN